MPDLLAIGPAWTWVSVGLALCAAEILLPGVFLLWLGLAGLLTGLAVAALPSPLSPPWQGQVLLFAALALAAVVVARHLDRGQRATDLNRADRGLIGREGVLLDPIRDGAGRIRFDDTLWRVHGPDLPAGARVRVTGLEGTVLCVAAAG